MARILLVTGGASGIGKATARLAAENGYDVAVNYRSREAEAARFVEELRGLGVRAVGIRADVQNPREVERLYELVDRELGTVTAVVNSAGVGLPPTSVADTSSGDLEKLFATNVIGLILSSREAVRRMSTAKGGKGGVIVNISSMAATIGGRPGNAPYAASKAAVDAFTVGLAKETAAQGIRAVSVRPGVIVTDMTEARLAEPEFAATVRASIPLGRPGNVSEVAKPVVWLLSDEASFITGTCLDVSGGGFHVARAQ